MSLVNKKFDPLAPVWDREAVREWLDERLVALRRKNDGDLDAVQTARIRGQIAEINNLLNLSAPPPPRPEPVGNQREEY